jgi:hypothetical protein
MAEGLIPYDNRPVSQAPPQQPEMAPQQYMMGISYTVAPITSIASPHFPPPPNQYDDFPDSSLPAPTPYRQPQYHPERPSLTIIPPEDRDREEHSKSPSVWSEPAPTTKAVPKVAKTVLSVISINPENEVSFDTEVDILMKAIQAKRETDTIVHQAEIKIKQEHRQPTPKAEAPSPSDLRSIPEARPRWKIVKTRTKQTKYICDIPDCGRGFYQKTHLDIHKRAHTGDKPYVSTKPVTCRDSSNL